MKPRIGIVGWKVGDNSFGATIQYMEYLSMFGEVDILSPSKYIKEEIDILVLPGGQDIMSNKYDQVPSYFNTNPDYMKEYFFENNLKQYIDAGKAVFGICLGMQQLAVYFGGGLDQNCMHDTSDSKKRHELIHEIAFVGDYVPLRKKLYEGLKHNEMPKVNSLHHQGIPLKELPQEFNPIALGPGDIVEAMVHRDLPIAAVQFHPEEIYDPLSIYMFETLMNTISTTEPLATV